MKKLTHSDLLPEARMFLEQGHHKIYATHDGQFFTVHSNAADHGKDIDSEVFNFSSEDLANIPYKDSGQDPIQVIDPPKEVKKIIKPKKR